MKRSSQTTSTSSRRRPSAVGRLDVYCKTRGTAWLEALIAARSHFAVEGIHELRVEIKRFRALYRLVEYVTPPFAAKPGTSSLKELFCTAGTLRDIDIRQAIVLPLFRRLDLREYFNQLKHDELAARAQFLKVATPLTSSALTKDRARIKAALSVMTDDKIRMRVDKKIRKLNTDLCELVQRKRPSDDDLHAIRKVSKALRYTLDVRQTCFGASAAADSASVRLKRTYGYLGDWHDAVVTLDSVKTFLRNQKRSDLFDPAAYDAFLTDLRDRAERLLAAYEQGRKPLLKALTRLSKGLPTRSKRRPPRGGKQNVAHSTR